MLTPERVLKHIERQPKHSANYKQLLRELGLHGAERRELTERLHELVKRGDLLQTDGDRYAIPKARSGKDSLVGRLSLHRDGFGFVIPDAHTLDPRLKSRLAGDVFIPPPFIGSAMHGDRVLVDVTAFRPDGRAEGRIVRTVVRAHPTVVGKFHYGNRYNYVTPMDAKVTQEIVIPRGMEYPEGHESAVEEPDAAPDPRSRQRTTNDQRPTTTRGKGSPHRVLGNEAARRLQRDDLENVIVDVEITDWPTATQNPRGRVVEVLGYEDDFGVDVEIIIRKFHLPHRFQPEVLQEAEEMENVIPAAELRRRHDYRDTAIVTIDGETARDFDDAVRVSILENGNYELQVHIADVAHYVTPLTALDQEARLRGTSVYFPDRAVPMLPLELSTDICSLRPRLDRLVMSCVMEIDHQGEVVGYTLDQGVIRSAERMTYTDVHSVLEGDKVLRQRYAPLVEMFERMRDLAMILNRKRERRGSIDFDLPEPVIEFDENGLMKGVTRSERNIAHRLIEEFMLAANECVAGHLESQRVASLYRIHEKPDAKRVYDFEVLAATFGYSLGVGPLPIHRVQMKADRRARHGTGKRPREIEVPKDVHITPRMYQKLAEKIAGKPEERILSYLMLRSLKQARYSEENLGHFALASPTYTHFTSPIRRYPDLIVHRILKDVLGASGGSSPGTGTPGPETAHSSHGGDRKHHDSGPSPWSKRRDHAAHQAALEPLGGPIPLVELHEIAEESSHSERRADEAERELMEWKKVKFMQDRVGEDFDSLITSVTKYGFFVELTDLFVEGLVPLNSLTDDHYTYHETTREIIGQRYRKTYAIGQRMRVILDRIDPVEKKLQFAVFEEPMAIPAKRKRS
jgi:ribonuclease R